MGKGDPGSSYSCPWAITTEVRAQVELGCYNVTPRS